MPSGGRPSPTPLIKPFSFLIDKARVPVSVHLDGRPCAEAWLPSPPPGPAAAPPLTAPEAWSDPAGEPQQDGGDPDRLPARQRGHGTERDRHLQQRH